MALRIAIVGLSPATHHMAPWGDPDWEIWGLPWDEGYWPYMDRLFEMHDMRLLESEHSRRKDGYFDRLKDCGVPLYMQSADDSIGSIAYPFDDVAETTGYYWNSSIAYALAMAIHEGATEIGIFGVDMKGDDEYGYQRPNLEYLIGLAIGKGIKVYIPDESPLCKFQPTGIKFFDHEPTYVGRYGWLG